MPANIAPTEHRSDPLTGQYVRQGSTLTGPSTLLLVHRASTTKAKASTYVLRVADDGKRSYVSSLWDGPAPGTYALEYRGIRYAVTLLENEATVTPAQVGTPPYINRGSGNSIAA